MARVSDNSALVTAATRGIVVTESVSDKTRFQPRLMVNPAGSRS